MNQSLTQKTCEECGRDFNVESVELWAYKLSIKGKTHWFCRWNCVRAGEKKLKASKRRKEDLNPNKPTKDELEKCLSQGMTVKDIAAKCSAGKSTV
jgi:YHS domain-containing protein